MSVGERVSLSAGEDGHASCMHEEALDPCPGLEGASGSPSVRRAWRAVQVGFSVDSPQCLPPDRFEQASGAPTASHGVQMMSRGISGGRSRLLASVQEANVAVSTAEVLALAEVSAEGLRAWRRWSPRRRARARVAM